MTAANTTIFYFVEGLSYIELSLRGSPKNLPAHIRRLLAATEPEN